MANQKQVYRTAVIENGEVVNIIVCEEGFELPGKQCIPLCRLCEEGINDVEPLLEATDLDGRMRQPGKGWMFDGKTFTQKPFLKDQLKKDVFRRTKDERDKGTTAADGTHLPVDTQVLKNLQNTITHAGMLVEDDPESTIVMRSRRNGLVERRAGTFKQDAKAILDHIQFWLRAEKEINDKIDNDEILTVNQANKAVEEFKTQGS